MRDDIVLVTDMASTTIVTLYRVDFGFPGEANKVAIDSLKAEIEKLRNEFEGRREEIKTYLEERIADVDSIKFQINNLKEQVEILEQQKKMLLSEIEGQQLGLQLIDKQMYNYAHMLCNNVDFKKDLNKEFK
jgi:dsDNA-specific endonuclease/ATPase MutS2